MNDLLTRLGEILNEHLFTVGSTPVTVATLLMSMMILVGSAWLGRVLRRGIVAAMTRGGARLDTAISTSGMVYYLVLIIGFAVALNTAGIRLATVFAAGAIFAVGIGIAMQSIAQNFVAGIIILTERSIKAGDLLEVEGNLVKVMEMGIRAGVARTRDGEDLIIPNAVLIQTTVKNFTHRESTYRVRIPVGVVYSSDMDAVREALYTAARTVSEKWSSPRDAMVLMTEFGSSSVNFDVGIWITDPWERRVAASELYFSVWNTFRARNIVIAFPQLDLHLDPEVSQSLTALAGRAA
jgi:small-conductance mechanosensitive channel